MFTIKYGKNELEVKPFPEEVNVKNVMDVFFSGFENAIDVKAKQKEERDLDKLPEARKTYYEYKKELLEKYKSKINSLHDVQRLLNKDEDLINKRVEYEKIISVLEEVDISYAPLKKGYNRIFKDRDKNFKSLEKSIKETQGLPINKGIVSFNGEILEFELDGYDVALNSENFERLSSAMSNKNYKREKVDLYTIKDSALESQIENVELVKKFLKLPVNREYVPEDVLKSEKNMHDLVQGRNSDYQLVSQYSEYLKEVEQLNESIEKKRAAADLITNSYDITDSEKKKLIKDLNKKMVLDRKKYEKAFNKVNKFKEENGIEKHLSNAKNYKELFNAMEVVEQPFADPTPEQLEYMKKNQDFIRDVWRGETYKYCTLEKKNDDIRESLAKSVNPPGETNFKESKENSNKTKSIENPYIIE